MRFAELVRSAVRPSVKMVTPSFAVLDTLLSMHIPANIVAYGLGAATVGILGMGKRYDLG